MIPGEHSCVWAVFNKGHHRFQTDEGSPAMPKTNHSRRDFLRKTAAAAFAAAPAAGLSPALADVPTTEPPCEPGGCCIIKSGDFYNVERGNAIPYKQPIEKLREIGMVRETWELENGDEIGKLFRPRPKTRKLKRQ
jgi:hypothetical protein